jgi:hypothetical protein
MQLFRLAVRVQPDDHTPPGCMESTAPPVIRGHFVPRQQRPPHVLLGSQPSENLQLISINYCLHGYDLATLRGQ